MVKPDHVPYIVYEGEMARSEMRFKAFMRVIVFLIILLFASNGVWLYAYLQYDYSDVEVTAEDGSAANYIGRDMEGDINNGGENQSKNEKETDRFTGNENENTDKKR